MPKKWSEVEQSPEYQALPDEEKERAREAYFYDVVAPQLDSPDAVIEAKIAFDNDTRPKPPPEDTYGETVAKAGRHIVQNFKAQAGGAMQAVGEQDKRAAKFIANRIKDGDTMSAVATTVASLPSMLLNKWFPEVKQTKEALAEKGREMAVEAKQAIEADPYRAEDASLKYYLGPGIEMFGSNIVPMVATSLVAGPGAGLALMSGQVFSQKYGQARAEGRDEAQAAMDGAFYALSEVATEFGPLGAALKPGSAFLKRLAKTSIGEGIGEVINQVAQKAYDLGIVDETTDVGEFLRLMSDNAALREYRDSLVLGAAAGGGMATISHPVVSKQEGRFVNDIKDIANNVAFEKLDDYQLNEAIKRGEELASSDKYGKDAELRSAVDALKAEKALRTGEPVGSDTQRPKQQGDAPVVEERGPLSRAANVAAATGLADDVLTDNPPPPVDLPEVSQEAAEKTPFFSLVDEGKLDLGKLQAKKQQIIDAYDSMTPEQQQQADALLQKIAEIERRAAAETPVVPEGEQAIQAQVDEMMNPASAKDAVLITPGSAVPSSIPDGVEVVDGERGTLLTTNADKAALYRERQDDSTMADILGYAQDKEQLAGAVQAGEDLKTVQAKNADGQPVHEELTTESDAEQVKTKVEQQFPGAEVEIKAPEDVLDERAPVAVSPSKKQEYVDPRLKRESYRNWLKSTVDNDLVKGGGIALVPREGAKRTSDTGDPLYDFGAHNMVRTPSLNPKWAQNIIADEGVSVDYIRHAVNKALEGQRLGKKQARVVRAVLDSITEERTSPENIEYAMQRRLDALNLRRMARAARPLTQEEALSLPVPEFYADEAMAGEVYEEDAYEPEWDGEARALSELARDAMAIDEAAAEKILERNQPDSVAARQLWEVISNAKRQQEAEGGRQEQQPEGAGAAEEGQGERVSAEAPPLELKQETPEDLERKAEAERKAKEEERQAEEKARADEALNSFVLTGSELPADQAAARGQQDLLAQAEDAKAKKKTKPLKTIRVQQEVIVDGKKTRVAMDASLAINLVEERLKGLQQLRKCLRG